MQPRPFGDELAAAVRHYLHENNLTQRHLTGEILADIGQRFYDHYQERQKARKKREVGGLVEREIYCAYPRHVAPQDAYNAIRLALGKTDSRNLLGAVQKYASCVARWPASYRYKEGRDLVPHPATWFNRGSWQESEKEWLPAGMFQREDDPRPTPLAKPETLLEPEEGWREKVKDHETLNIFFGRDWNTINDFYKRQIIQHSK
jgi:hypothetical protein